jgi:Protein of unknown function (DUF2471)
MSNFDFSILEAMKTRLEAIIGPIVEQHRSVGDSLTWNLLHAIEETAMAQLEQTGDFDKRYLDMVRPHRMMPYPHTDEPVDFGKSNAIPMAFGMIHSAYTLSH